MKAWIGDRFGSRRGLARFLKYQFAWWMRPDRVKPEDVKEVSRLVFVCKGNICRSAMAEAVARSRGFPACSFGTNTHLGKPANPGMAATAVALGYDLSGHRTSPLDTYAWQPGDLVLVFEPHQLRELESGAGKDWRVDLLGKWARPRRAYIHDPFEGTTQYYQRVGKLVEEAVVNLLGDIRGENA